MRLFLYIFTLFLSMTCIAECLVQLDTNYNRGFVQFTCSKALRDCNRYKKLHRLQDKECLIIDGEYQPESRRRDNNQYRYSRTIIEDFINGKSNNCEVIANVDGQYHQVFIDGNFKGNYNYSIATDLRELQNLLNKYVFLKRCHYELN